MQQESRNFQKIVPFLKLRLNKSLERYFSAFLKLNKPFEPPSLDLLMVKYRPSIHLLIGGGECIF